MNRFAPWSARSGILLAAAAVLTLSRVATAQTVARWTDAEPAGVFFNDYDPNFYTGWVPRVQEADRFEIHLGRGNQLRVRMVLSDATLDNYLLDQVAKHDLYQEVIDEQVIELITNTSWEDYHQRFEDEGLREKASRKGSVPDAEWSQLNVQAIERLNPERLYHIQKDFDAMVAEWRKLLAASEPPEEIEGKLELVNALFPHRLFVIELNDEQDANLSELMTLAKGGDDDAFRAKTEAFFHDVTNCGPSAEFGPNGLVN